MASYGKSLVDIPDDKGVHVKSAGAKGEKYVYKYVKYFRNADGAPRNKAKAIGKFDPESGKMYPNNNYYDIYHLDHSLPDISVWDYGYSYLVLKVCRDSGLFDCLSQTFGRNAMDIIIMAAYMIREGNSMDGIDDWQQRNYFPGVDHLLTSQTSSKKFASITITKQNEFFKHWIKVAMESGSVCYDVTSISSYSQEIASVEPGYNRDGENLAQYNLGMFCNEVTKVPLYGIPGRVLIYYDPYNHINQCNEISNRINRLKAELAALVRYPKKKLSRYTPYFVLTKHEQDSGFDYAVDTDKVEKMRERKGYFLIFSTDMESTPSDTLDNYRAKDADEKLFAQIKVDMEGDRIRTHKEETTDGKAFVIFIACVIRSYLLNRLSNYLADNSTYMKKVFSQLSNITILLGNDGYRFTKALTKKQKQILSAFNAVDDIKDSIK